MQSIPPTTADKQTLAQKRRGSRSRKLLGAKAKSYRLKNYIRLVTRSTDRLAPAGNRECEYIIILLTAGTHPGPRPG